MAQITKEATVKMRQVMSQRGHSEGESSRMLAKLYVVLTIIFLTNTIIDICSLEAYQVEEKIFRFKTINMMICGLAYPLVNRDTFRLLSCIEEQGRYDSGSGSSKARISLQKQLDSELDQVNKLSYFVIVFIMGTMSVAPLIASILNISPKLISGSLDTIDVTEFNLPVSFWYPEEYATLFTYFSLYALQMFYIYLFSGYMYCVLVSGFMALKITIYNLKFLCLIVEEGQDELKVDGLETGKFRVLEGGDNHLAYKLKDSIVNVIKLHEMICGRATFLSKNLESMYTVFNNIICFQMCVCLFSSVKMEDLVLKVEHLLLVVPMAYILFLYCSNAQELLNEGEKFRMTLYGGFFVDKPRWYKSSILMMMIRTSKELEIRPFGFYVLNLTTFSMVMKAAYSYFNMLNSLKKRI